MKKNLSVLTRTKFMRTGISFLLAVIDIALVAQLKQDGNAVLKAAGLTAGVILFTVLTERLFRQRERRLIVHAGLWGLLMSAAYVAGCLMRRDGTLFDGIGSLPGALLACCVSRFRQLPVWRLFCRVFRGCGSCAAGRG